jgi:protein-L-isoaspartate(D-aspartate) O-methyltransferase
VEWNGERANNHLVDRLIAQGALWSGPLIDAFRATPRHYFLKRVWRYHSHPGEWREMVADTLGTHELRVLYSDRALTTRLSEASPGCPAVPISSSSQPSLMAEMLEDLRLEPGLTTLEIGAGTGYNAALMAHVVAQVISLDVDQRVLAEAAEHLRAFPDRRVVLRLGDGRKGCPDQAPFDRILVTAAALDLEPAWLEQLADGGIVIAPLDLAPGLGYLVEGSCRQGVFYGCLTRPAYFMPLRAENEDARGIGVNVSKWLPSPESLQASAAPWAEWSERKSSSTAPRLLPSLAFLAWLNGYTVGYQSLADGRVGFGILDSRLGRACWFGPRQWLTTDPEGRTLAKQLWRQFLAAGGPWPTEFQLRAVPLSQPKPEQESDSILTFLRPGTRCWQHWTLPAHRQRPASL